MIGCFLQFALVFLVATNQIDCVFNPNVLQYQTRYLTQFVDHFNFNDDRTFQQRYLVNDDFFDRDHNGVVLFYTGNEGDIVSFWENTGLLFDIAPLFSGLIVFCEHRYYGKSLPFGDDSFKNENIHYLTIEQALADYAVFLTDLKKQYNLTTSNPIIAFGGSYGGILSAYMRFKYPNLVLGAIAASAPLYLTAGLSDNNLFFSAVTEVPFMIDLKDFNRIPECVPLIRQAFLQMNKTVSEPNGYSILSDKFKLCNPISDQAGYNHLIGWMRNAFASITMADYPYAASFMGALPAWPVNASCALLINEFKSGTDILTAFKDLVGLFYNDTTTQCFDIYTQYVECVDPTGCGLGNDASAWDYQACVELNTVQETNGITDMFPAIPFTSKIREDYCKRVWNVSVREDWPGIQFWGRNISTATNIVFSNGRLDPWHAGGVLEDISDTLVAVVIADGAHHLDIRGSNPADPDSVIQARIFEIDLFFEEQISKWISKKPK